MLNALSEHNNLIARLMESLIYYDYGNKAKAESIIKDLLQEDFNSHVFSSETTFASYSDITDQTLEMLSKLKEREISQNALETLVFYIHFHTTSELRDRLDQSFDIPKGMSQIQAKYSKIIYGQEMPFVWAPILFEESSRKEYSRFVSAAMKFKKVGKPSDLLLFRGFPSIPKKRKDSVRENFVKLSDSSNTLEQSIYFSLLDNETFYRFASNNEKIKLGLILNKKRNYFKSLLNNVNLREYALLSLISIGDIDLEMIEKHILPNE